MVDQLADEYASANKPAIFIEQAVDDPVDYARYSRWWAAHGGGSVTLPLVMVDSGNQVSNGSEDFYAKYSSMVGTALARPPQATISAVANRDGNAFHFDIEVTNLSGDRLSYENSATVFAIVYEEDATDGLTKRYVRATDSTYISELAHGATDSFALDTPPLTGVNWDKLHLAALVDYRPMNGSNAYDMLQAALEVTPPQPNFVLSNIASTKEVEGGEILTYTISVKNTGETILHATITDTPPIQVSYSGATTWSATISQSQVWSTTLAVTVDPDPSGALVNSVTVSTAEGISQTAYALTNVRKEYFLPLNMRP